MQNTISFRTPSRARLEVTHTQSQPGEMGSDRSIKSAVKTAQPRRRTQTRLLKLGTS